MRLRTHRARLREAQECRSDAEADRIGAAGEVEIRLRVASACEGLVAHGGMHLRVAPFVCCPGGWAAGWGVIGSPCDEACVHRCSACRSLSV
jgi:hypothetical protein